MSVGSCCLTNRTVQSRRHRPGGNCGGECFGRFLLPEIILLSEVWLMENFNMECGSCIESE